MILALLDTNVLLDAIVTRDPAGFVQSVLPVWSPAELLARLAGPPQR